MARVERAWSLLDARDPALVVDAVALNLHGVYGVIERLFEIIARQIDRNLPAGSRGTATC